MPDEEKLVTVGQVVRGDGPAMDPEGDRRLSESVSGRWEKYSRKFQRSKKPIGVVSVPAARAGAERVPERVGDGESSGSPLEAGTRGGSCILSRRLDGSWHGFSDD